MKKKPKEEEARAASYNHHLFEENEAVLLLWPVLMFIFHVITAAISLFHRTYSKGHAVVTLACCLCCWYIYKAAMWRSSKLLRGLFVLFGFLQMVFYLNYLRGEDTVANVHLYLDLGTNLYSITPQLVMGLTGAPLLAYMLFISSHVAAATLFYLHVAKMTMPWALLRAAGIHMLTFSAALAVHKRARPSYKRRLACQKELLQGEDEAAIPTKPLYTPQAMCTPKAMHAPELTRPPVAERAHAASAAKAGTAAAARQRNGLIPSLLESARPTANTATASTAAEAAAAPQRTCLISSLPIVKSARPTAVGLLSAVEGGEVGTGGLEDGKDGHAQAPTSETAPWSSFVAVQQQQQQQGQQKEEVEVALEMQQRKKQQQQQQQEAGATQEQQRQQKHQQLLHARVGEEGALLAVASLSGPANLLNQADQKVSCQPAKLQEERVPITSPHIYRSALKRRTAQVKVHAKVSPDQITRPALEDLRISLQKALPPGTLVPSVCVRHGCIILSLRWCSLSAATLRKMCLGPQGEKAGGGRAPDVTAGNELAAAQLGCSEVEGTGVQQQQQWQDMIESKSKGSAVNAAQMMGALGQEHGEDEGTLGSTIAGVVGSWLVKTGLRDQMDEDPHIDVQADDQLQHFSYDSSAQRPVHLGGATIACVGSQQGKHTQHGLQLKRAVLMLPSLAAGSTLLRVQQQQQQQQGQEKIDSQPQQQQQQQQQQGQQSLDTANWVAVEVPVDVQPPVGSGSIAGWQPLTHKGTFDEGSTSKEGTSEEPPTGLQMVACWRGTLFGECESRFCPLRIEEAAAPASVPGEGRCMQNAKAFVSLPLDLVTSCADSGCLLDLELWAGRVCVACQPVLLLPQCMADLMEEVQAWADTVLDTAEAAAAASDQVADFVYDLGQWLLLQAIMKSTLTLQQEPESPLESSIAVVAGGTATATAESAQVPVDPMISSSNTGSAATVGAAATTKAEGNAAMAQLALVLQTLGQDLYEHAVACDLPCLKALLRQAGYSGATLAQEAKPCADEVCMGAASGLRAHVVKASCPAASACAAQEAMPCTNELCMGDEAGLHAHVVKTSCHPARSGPAQETKLCADMPCMEDAGRLRAHSSSPFPMPGLHSMQLTKDPRREGCMRQVSVSFESLSSDDIGDRWRKSAAMLATGDESSEMEFASEVDGGSSVPLNGGMGKASEKEWQGGAWKGAERLANGKNPSVCAAKKVAEKEEQGEGSVMKGCSVPALLPPKKWDSESVLLGLCSIGVGCIAAVAVMWWSGL